MQEFTIEALENHWRVYHGSWGLGIEFPSEAAAERAIRALTDAIEDRVTRYALVSANAGSTDQIAAYLPDNYRVVGRTPIRGTNTVQILIAGSDVAGWTLDGYVLPRLASGMYYGDEVA